MTARPILISGAGLGGLLLARSLKNNNIPFILYERDHGLTALREVLTEEQYERFKTGTAATGAGGIHNLDAITSEESASKLPESEGSKASGPKLGGDVLGVARGWLRQSLFEGLEDLVQWGKRSTSYALASEGVTLHFADGTTSPEGSLLVAADGPHSAITKQLTNDEVKAYDTGARMIHGQSPASAFKQLGPGVWSAKDPSRIGLITNVRPDDFDKTDVEFGLVLAGPPGSFDAPDGNFSIVGKVAADLTRELTVNWHEKFRAIFQQQNDAEAAFLKMSTGDPKGVPEWKNDPRVTIMGDAAHAMTPAGGVGANTALRDAALIGRLIKEAGGWQESITATYEKEMRVYASENVKMSFEAAAGQFNITELK